MIFNYNSNKLTILKQRKSQVMLFCETVTRETEYCQFACFWHFVLLAQQHCFVNLMHESFETPAPPSPRGYRGHSLFGGVKLGEVPGPQGNNLW